MYMRFSVRRKLYIFFCSVFYPEDSFLSVVSGGIEMAGQRLCPMEENRISVLVVDDEPVALKSLQRILEADGYDVLTAANVEKAVELVESGNFAVVVTDLLLDVLSGLDLLERVKNISADTEVILVTGHGSIDTAIEATKKGAFHYLQKPIRPGEIRSIVKQAVEKRTLALRVRELEAGEGPAFSSITGKSPAIAQIKKLIKRIATSDSNVLITGESGTGKELVARAIHETSPRRNGRFLAFNCASFTDELLANELFGHEKDAFTGATRSAPGLLESADGGTVFLDEVGDMPGAMQAKLLRVIQEREVIRVGGTKPVPVDIRIIAATNKDLKKLCEGGYFRRDLFFRLNVIPVHMPNLADRREDIPMLASYFLRRYCRKMNKTINGFSDEALGMLTSYGYPGNIRELENIVEHAVSMASGPIVQVENLPEDLTEYDVYTFHKSDDRLKSLEEVEREYIRWVLDRVGNRKAEAARVLGIDRTSLYRKLKRFEFKE